MFYKFSMNLLILISSLCGYAPLARGHSSFIKEKEHTRQTIISGDGGAHAFHHNQIIQNNIPKGWKLELLTCRANNPEPHISREGGEVINFPGAKVFPHFLTSPLFRDVEEDVGARLSLLRHINGKARDEIPTITENREGKKQRRINPATASTRCLRRDKHRN